MLFGAIVVSYNEKNLKSQERQPQGLWPGSELAGGNSKRSFLSTTATLAPLSHLVQHIHHIRDLDRAQGRTRGLEGPPELLQHTTPVKLPTCSSKKSSIVCFGDAVQLVLCGPVPYQKLTHPNNPLEMLSSSSFVFLYPKPKQTLQVLSTRSYVFC
jgi:hypothetical protein